MQHAASRTKMQDAGRRTRDVRSAKWDVEADGTAGDVLGAVEMAAGV